MVSQGFVKKKIKLKNVLPKKISVIAMRTDSDWHDFCKHLEIK